MVGRFGFMKTIFDRFYKRYDAWYDRNISVYLSELIAIKKVLPKKSKGLEIGVGTGRFAVPLGITTGIDPSKNMIKIARQRGIKARLGLGERLPFRNYTFDYVAIIITICFVQEPLKVLEETKRVLKKGGGIIIGIIDKDSFLGKLYQRKKSVFYDQAHFFKVVEIKNLLKKVGFNKFYLYQTISKPPNKMKSIEKPKRGFGKGGFVVISARS